MSKQTETETAACNVAQERTQEDWQREMDGYKAIRCFRIIRFYKNGRNPRTIRQSMTETEAQAHCSKETTHGEGWFDGYDYMKGCRP